MKYSLALLAAAVAVQASPVAMPQAVTAKISPSAPAPSGCTGSYSGTFGIAVMNVTKSASGSAKVTSLADGQPGAGSQSAAPVTTISDGQPQASTGVAPVTTIADGQPQATTGAALVSTIADGQPQAKSMMTMAQISQIGDGQIQGGMHTVTMMAVSQISDGQIQNPTVTMMAVTTISDGQPQAPTMATPTATAVTTLSDGQVNQPTGTAISVQSDGQPTASAASASSTAQGVAMAACSGNSTLKISLADGVLTDDLGRTGYIAANYQFQFDKPPQAGAIYTSGFSVCANGSLALGGSNVFYQCLSGDFYNLYNEDWAAQCSPVTINALQLIDCSA